MFCCDTGDSGNVTYEVKARSKYNKIMDVTKGSVYSFSASGEWKDAIIKSSPDGYVLYGGICNSLLRYKKEDSKYFTLIGCVLDKDSKEIESFRIGSGTQHTFKTSGKLCMYANDGKNFYFNNSGSITVSVKKQ